MADFELNRLYGISYDIVKYEQTTQLPIYEDAENPEMFMTPTGQYITRHKTSINKVLSFWFYSYSDNVKSYDGITNTVNKNQICLGDYKIKPGKALIRNIEKRKVPVLYETKSVVNGQETTTSQKSVIYQIFVQMQIEVQKPLLYQKVPMMGYYFKDTDGKIKRIQRVACENVFADTVQLEYGYGFFSESRHDLDVPYKMFLKEDGSIAFKQEDVHMVQYKIRKESQWRGLRFPTVEGVQKNGK